MQHRPRHRLVLCFISPYSFPGPIRGIKKSPAPYLGQDLKPSCGTTQVAGYADRSFLTPHYVSRIDNGYGSRRPLLACWLSCRPHKSIHLTLHHGISTINRSLNMLGKATLLNRRFFLLLTIYHRAGGLSRLFLKKLIFFTKGGEGSVPIRRKAKK